MISVSSLAGSGLLGTEMTISFDAFVSVLILTPLLCALKSGVLGATPFGLLDVVEDGRCRTPSAVLD